MRAKAIWTSGFFRSGHHNTELQILDRISLQYAPNANGRKTNERYTKRTNYTENANERTHDTRTNESLERNHILPNDKRSWFYRSTI